MPGFANDASGNSIVWADNADFSGNVIPSRQITLDGQLFIGATAAPNIRSNTLTAGTGVTITNGPGTITIGLSGGGAAVEHLTGTTGGQLNPTANNFNLLGGTSAAGTTPVSVAGSGSTLTTNVQISQALAAADATKIGLSNFSSASFAVAATGFVTLIGSVPQTFTGDSGASPAVPSAGNLNIVGLSGSQTSTSGSTVTIYSPKFVQIGSSGTSAKNTGEYVTGVFTRTLPASAGLIDGDLIQFVATTAGALTIQSVTAQKIRIGSIISAAAGSAVSTAIGDSVSLRFNATDGFWYATQVIGTWVVA